MFIDLLIINFSAIAAFVLREIAGYQDKMSASEVLDKYLISLLLWNLLFVFIFWMLGAYDRRQKRVVIEEFVLILGLFSTGLAIQIAFMFLGQMWWMSRAIVFMFWGFSISLLCFSRLFFKKAQSGLDLIKLNVKDLELKLKDKKNQLDQKLKEALSIVIVNTNEKEKLSRCLKSLMQAGIKVPLEIIVVDNQSIDGTIEFLKKEYSQVKIVKNPQNLGYPRSVNNGLRAASADYCLILNPDIMVLPGSIEIMLQYLIEHPQVGLTGCKLLNEDGSLQYSVRRFLDARTYLYRFTPFRGLMAGSSLERYYLMQDWDHNDTRLVDWVLGGCMMVRRKAFEEIGMMDEKIFLYFDDVDWCYQMWDQGWQIAYVADAVIFHKHMRTSANKIFNRAAFEHMKSLFYFLAKRGLRFPKNCPSSQEK